MIHRPAIAFAACALACLLADSTRAAVPAPAVRTVPATLWWRNGESLPGALESADATSITWRCPLVAGPVVLDRSRLLLMDLPQPPARAGAEATAKAQWSVLMRNGDCIHADEASLAPGSLTLVCARHGLITVPLAAVRSLRRLRGGDLVYAGPCGRWDWTGEGFATDGGALATRQWNETLELPVELPATMAMDVALRSTDLLHLKLMLRHATLPCPSLECWGHDLVLVAPQGSMHFTPLMQLPEGASSLAIRLYLDLAAGDAKVFSIKGEELGSLHWSVADANKLPAPPEETLPELRKRLPYSRKGVDLMAPPPPGIAIRNRGENWVMDELCVRRWDGRLPGATPTEVPRVELIDDTWRSGPDAPVPELDQVRSVTWSEELPPLHVAQLRPAVMFADGTMISGAITGFSNGGLDVLTPWQAAPLHSSSAGLVRVVFEPSLQPVEEPPLSSLDLLRQEKLHVHGHLSGNGGPEPLWRFVGGMKDLPLVIPESRDVDVTWGDSDGNRMAEPIGSFLITDAGDVLNARLRSVSGSAVLFSSPWTEAQSIAGDHMRAMHIARPGRAVEGFRDAAWGTDKDELGAEVKTADKPTGDCLRLPMGSSFSHPSLVQGDDIHFSVGGWEPYGVLELGLFCPRTEEEADAEPLQIRLRASSGRQIYASLADRTQRPKTSRGLRVPAGAPYNVAISFRDTEVRISINNMEVMVAGVNEAQARSHGFKLGSPSITQGGLSPGGMIEVSNFRVMPDVGEFTPLKVAPQARREALMVPRARHSSPPTHVLVAENGDLIRGRLESVSNKELHFLSGLDTAVVPLERVRDILWLAPSAVPGSGVPATPPPQGPEPTHWLMLRDSSQLALKMEKFTGDRLVGSSRLLGKTELPYSAAAVLRWSPPPASAALRSYMDWRLENAPEPVLPEGGSQFSPLLGKAAPDFSLPLLEDGRFKLSQCHGEVVVIDFWATWCGPCVASMPELIKVMKTFDGQKVRLISVNQGESADKVRSFLRQRGWDLPVAMDEDQGVAGKYQVEGIPHTLVIDAEGKVVWAHTGFTADGAEKLAEAVRKALEGS